MYKLYILHGKENIRAFDSDQYERIEARDMDELEFWTVKEGLMYIKQLKKNKDKDFRFLTRGEVENIS